MKIKTSDGKIFDVPENNVESFLSDYNAFQDANKELAELSLQLNRGNNIGGGARNFAQGATMGGADELEAETRANSAMGTDLRNKFQNLSEEQKEYYRNNPKELAKIANEVYNENYDKYLKNARESYKGFGRSNPKTALGLQFAGGLAPTALTFGAGAPASAATGTRMLVGGLSGLGYGTISGFLSGEGGLKNRLDTAYGSGGLGLALGALTPPVISGFGRAANTTKRIVTGFPKNTIPETSTSSFILNKAMANTPEVEEGVASVLNKGSAAGALDIYNPAYRMRETLKASKGLRNPGMLTDTFSESPAAQTIINSAKTPQLKLAEQNYKQFLQSVEDTPGQGLAAQQFLKRNPVANKILGEEQSLKGLKVGSFEWFKNAERTLNNSLPKTLDTQRAVGRRANILNSIDDISNIRENIHPGTTKANADYAIGKAWQERANDVAQERLNYIGNLPVEDKPGGSVKDILKIFYNPYLRGRARELIKNDGMLYQGPSSTVQSGAQTVSQDILNTLRNYTE